MKYFKEFMASPINFIVVRWGMILPSAVIALGGVLTLVRHN